MKTWIQIETDEAKPNWYRSRKRATELLGHSLGRAEVHHHTDGTIVICEDKAYHGLLQQRTDALKACSHASWRRCRYCGVYSSPEKLDVDKSGAAAHKNCRSQYDLLRRCNLIGLISIVYDESMDNKS